jgi:hypothetical protein
MNATEITDAIPSSFDDTFLRDGVHSRGSSQRGSMNTNGSGNNSDSQTPTKDNHGNTSLTPSTSANLTPVMPGSPSIYIANSSSSLKRVNIGDVKSRIDPSWNLLMEIETTQNRAIISMKRWIQRYKGKSYPGTILSYSEHLITQALL